MIRHPKREAGNAMMHCDDSSFSLFEAFGLRIRSDLPLGCLSAEGEGEDVVIRLGQVGAGKTEPESAGSDGPDGGESVQVEIEETGRFLIRGGREIVAEPAASPDEGTLSLNLAVTEMVLPILLYQRGLSVFHASTVEIDGGAVAFMGTPGVGKSRYAASLLERGGSLVDDDILALAPGGDCPMALPGYPFFKIWTGSAERFQSLLSGMTLMLSNDVKCLYRMDGGFSRRPAPLRKVFILQDGAESPETPLSAPQAVKGLMDHWFGLLYKSTFEASGGYRPAMEQSAALARKVPVFRIDPANEPDDKFWTR